MRTPWVLVQLLALSVTFGCFDEGDSERPEATGGGGSSTSSTGGRDEGGVGGDPAPAEYGVVETEDPPEQGQALCAGSKEAVVAPLGRVDAFASAQFAVSQLRNGRPLDSATLRFAELESLIRTAEPPEETSISVNVLADAGHFVAVADLDLAVSKAPVDLVVVLDNGVRRDDGMYREVLTALHASLSDHDSLEVQMALDDGTLASEPDWASGFQTPRSTVLSTLDALTDLPFKSQRVVLLTPGELDGRALGEIAVKAEVADPTLVQIANFELDPNVRFAANDLYLFTNLTGGRALFFGAKDEAAAFFEPRFGAFFRGTVDASVEFHLSDGLKPFEEGQIPSPAADLIRELHGAGRFQAVGPIREEASACEARWIQAGTVFGEKSGPVLSADWQTLRGPSVVSPFDAVIFQLFQVLSVPTPTCSEVSSTREALNELDCLPEAQDCRSEELIEGLLDRLDEVCAG